MTDTPVPPLPGFTPEQIASSCQGLLHPEAIIGLRLFNERSFYEAHEALETAWRAETGPVRELYRGILQVGAGYYKIQRGSYNGALKYFLSCRKWLDLYPDTCRGVNVRKLRQDYQQIEAELIRLGPEQIALFNQDLFQPVEFLV
jgi:uncharacterized protein